MRRRSLIAAATAAVTSSMMITSALAAPPSPQVHGAAARELASQHVVTSSSGTTVPGLTSAPGDANLADETAQYENERFAPGTGLSGQALVDAQAAAHNLSTVGGAWQQVTNAPYQLQPANFTDPFWGNEGAGFSIVSGRATALIQAVDGTWFVGTAGGGVWRSTDQGQHWSPTFDSMPTQSIGALAIDPVDGSLWVGTGEANTSQDSYAGTGVYESTNDGGSYTRVGDSGGNNPLASRSVFQIVFDAAGDAYAATHDGLWRMAAGSHTWVDVLQPAGAVFPPYANQVTSVQIVPGTGGTDVIAAVGWRSQSLPTNGFYLSTDSGNTFTAQTTTGIPQADIGRTSFAYSADGSKLYAIVENPTPVTLQGFYVSTGSPASVAGPWTLIADSAKLAASGSASPTFGNPGEQAWYNQDLVVDPSNANHVYAGLEEVYQTTDGGTTWTTASPYWNYNFACDYTSPAPTCPNTTHPDQHAMMIANGQIVIGNDGGVYSRPLSDAAGDDGNWSDLNNTLRTLQYYDARAGALPHHGIGVWGGLQDNGTSVLTVGASQMNAPAGGDGFDVIVDPNNANNAIGEYTDGTMYLTADGGHSFADFISPMCAAQGITGLPGGPRSDCDPGARFVTPITMDQTSSTVWTTGGEDVWVDKSGWSTSCTVASCSWTPVYDTGAGNAVTALASTGGGSTIYAAWVGGGGNPGPAFASGIATNYGGAWHEINMSGLPNRYVAGVTVDPSNSAHVYAVFNGYSRRWIPGGGVGHVFESWNGGATWTDISTNLPDIAGDALVLSHGYLVLATDAGVYTAHEGRGSNTSWSKLGTGLPNVSVNDITVGPAGTLYAATHGRGIWSIRL